MFVPYQLVYAAGLLAVFQDASEGPISLYKGGNGITRAEIDRQFRKAVIQPFPQWSDLPLDLPSKWVGIVRKGLILQKQSASVRWAA